MKLRLLLASAFALLVAAPAAADGCVPTTTTPDYAIGPYYIDHSTCQPSSGCAFGSWWVYEESNGIDGLQRGDEVKDDTCGGQIPHDTILF